jgi:hypothetical protein
MSFLPAKKQKRSGEGNTFKNGGLEFAAWLGKATKLYAS